MLTKEAIEQIQEILSAAGQVHRLPINTILQPNGYQLSSVEKFRETPSFYRADLNTSSLDQFVIYCQQHSNDDTAIFISTNEPKAQAIFDLGSPASPLWGRHRAAVAIEKTPSFAALLQHSDTSLTQEQLIDFLEDWPDYLSAELAGGEQLSIAEVIRRLRRIDIKATAQTGHEVSNFAASRSALEEIEAKAKGGELPDLIIFKGRPWHELNPRTIYAKLRLKTGSEKPALAYRIVGLEQLKQDIAQEFRDSILSSTDCKRIHIGDFNYQ